MSYADFLAAKAAKTPAAGRPLDSDAVDGFGVAEQREVASAKRLAQRVLEHKRLHPTPRGEGDE